MKIKFQFLGLLLTSFFTIFDKIFSQKTLFYYTKVLINPNKVSEKGKKNPSWIQTIDRDDINIYTEKLRIQGRDITVISILHINAQDQ